MTNASEHPQDFNEAAETPESTHEHPAAEGADALATAQARVAELEAKLADISDKAMRALADADNTRKRLEKERQDTAKFAVSSFARNLLSVADNLGRALSAITPGT